MFLNLNKPTGPTSHDMVSKVRRVTGIKKVGHAGTLDPFASGVLVMAIGRESTKLIDTIVKTEKEYLATVHLGKTSTTDDPEGEITNVSNNSNLPNIPNEEIVKEVLSKFIGEIEQVPPIYSAIKIKGKPAHRRVRKGEDVKMEPRQVLIKEIELLEYAWPMLKIRVVTGPGTYIRALARDIGEQLGVGAYLEALERTRVGDYSIEDSITLDKLEKWWQDQQK